MKNQLLEEKQVSGVSVRPSCDVPAGSTVVLVWCVCVSTRVNMPLVSDRRVSQRVAGTCWSHLCLYIDHHSPALRQSDLKAGTHSGTAVGLPAEGTMTTWRSVISYWPRITAASVCLACFVMFSPQTEAEAFILLRNLRTLLTIHLKVLNLFCLSADRMKIRAELFSQAWRCSAALF